MCDRKASPPSSSSSSAAAVNRCWSRHSAEEEVGCTGRSCQSCTAGVIADCVAVCCCPCAVVNIFTLAFVKLPWSVARRCIGRRRERRRRLEEAMTSEIVVNIGEELLNDELGAELKGEEVWLELVFVSEFCVKHADCPVMEMKRNASQTPQDPVDD
ncbi:hypothetical protein SASPL_128270 [Salvia splendens]|uniref:Uncharacterized protein n=1 Tax=Salvia splendens TaxID=180675 RepID=A0A8X8ZMC1_SALSN|nr:hypothetical protein SASPL_128270 [Salvia splendens]